MGKESSTVDWRFEEENWKGRHEADASVVDPAIGETVTITATSRRRRIYWGVALTFSLLLLLTFWLWERAERGVVQIDDELQNAGQAELWLAKYASVRSALDPAAKPWHPQFQRDDSTLLTIDDKNSGSPFEIVWHLQALHDQIAMVDLVAHGATDNQSYRQRRFYRQTEAGWLRTAPDVDLWGSPRRLESKYFIFEFRQEDSEVVATAASKADHLYVSIRDNLGLTGDFAVTKQVIEVSVTKIPGASLSHISEQQRWRVPSPALYLAPVEQEGSDLLVQSIAFPLIARVVAEALHRDQPRSVWGPIVEALRLWLLWDSDLPLSGWRPELLTWRFDELPKAAQRQLSALPKGYAALCALYGLWLASPTQVGIPLSCDEQDRQPMNGLSEPRWMMGGAPNPSISPASVQDYLQPALVAPAGIYWMAQPDDTLMLETLLEYIESTYGRQGIVAFLAAMGEYTGSETLTQSTFGISTAEMMAGWRAYLTQQYGLGSGGVDQLQVQQPTP